MITAIVPLDLKRRPRDLIKKAVALADAAQKNDTAVIFGHNDRGTKYDSEIKFRLENHPCAKINSKPNVSTHVNSALLRNLAFELVETQYIIILDADIHPDFDLFRKYKRKISQGEKDFCILPCLYLTKYGSQLLLQNQITQQALKERFYEFSRKEFLHLASPSSITILKSADYKKLNGFDTKYEGHGYEDFDFLIRLCSLYNLINKPDDFLVDQPARSPLFAGGFRRYIGELCLEALFEKEMALHLFHAKDNKENYYMSREQNYQKLVDEHQDNLNPRRKYDSTLINTFVSLCEAKGSSVHHYSILFENKPGHIDRYDTFKRKFKFLFKR